MIVITINSLLFPVCSISLVASVMLSIYAKLSIHVFTIQERERAAVNMQGTVNTIARLKIDPTIRNLICSDFIIYD